MARRPPTATQPRIKAVGSFTVGEAERIRHLGLGFVLRDRRRGVEDQSHNSFGQPLASQGGVNTPSSFASYGYAGSNKKIDIPNGRVGVIIGKSGETIKYLQVQSGARIQVTRDMDADPHSQSRTVELIGTSDQISKAEQLINEVLAEAEAGGSGIISARKFTITTTGAEHFSMKVPNNKVGLIIGKGGETIRNMQTTSGARIQ
ncbi:far upstream element-binding protein 2-like, partial [Phalaenopsis equestris]|uniref:far upstream element-binding protein 2-like n=1 Tax=Phalaenopsis equestris TaxID=78828 RepID=UPI0009E23715